MPSRGGNVLKSVAAPASVTQERLRGSKPRMIAPRARPFSSPRLEIVLMTHLFRYTFDGARVYDAALLAPIGRAQGVVPGGAEACSSARTQRWLHYLHESLIALATGSG